MHRSGFDLNAPISNHTHPLEQGIVRVMSDATIPYRGSISKTLPAPLSADERALCDRVAARLHSDLSNLVEQLPSTAQNGSGMSKHLNIVRNTCQRVMHAIRDQSPNAQTLVKLPGVKGLEQMLDAMRSTDIKVDTIELAQSAVVQFDQLINSLAGSHTKLASRINAAGTVGTHSYLGSAEAREQLFQSAINVTGRSAATNISLYAFRQSPENPDVLQRALASGLLQTTVVPGGMPVVIRAGDTLQWDDPENRTLDYLDDSKPHGNTPDALLKEFTTHPLPTVSSQGTSDNLIQVIDPANFDGPQTLDVITAARSNHPFRDPKTGNLTLDEVWSLVNCPSARMLFDIYLHRDLERMVRPQIDAQLWYPNLSSPGGQRWITRYPSPPRLELLGDGISRAKTPSHPRHFELTGTLFDRVGWDPYEFVGFRCEVIYPIWRAGYCMSFQPVDRDLSTE
ncbi:MAG: hypothetical protein P1U42_07855 [Phycisphaerales bacterium]|nr:hypothetical protein [Phycisphaerales bacterium]